MLAVQVDHIVKSYATKVAVDDLSFSVARGEVFGLIGPNGAGKTTSIRMMMDIIKPDSGEVLILGERIGETGKNRLGYLPEDRGLYRKLSVIDSIVYLASLKGVGTRGRGEIRAVAPAYRHDAPRWTQNRGTEQGHGADNPVHRDHRA